MDSNDKEHELSVHIILGIELPAREVLRCVEVAAKAINECRRDENAIRIAAASAEAIAGDILKREDVQIDAVLVGNHRVKYSVMTRNQLFDVDFWASSDEFKPRLLRAIRHLRRKERLSFLISENSGHI